MVIKIIINKNKKKPKGERWEPHPAHKFESKCSVRPAVYLWPVTLPTPTATLPLAGAHSNTPAPTGLPFLLLTGALLPQSSEMERRLKMGRRRPGSRLGDSDPLRLPELREPLR